MVVFPVTLSDLKLHQTTPLSTFYTAFHIFVMGGDKNSNSVGRLIVGTTYGDDKPPMKGAWSGHVTDFNVWWP